ncbi:MAG: adenosylcobinamide-GDP ribazoletransferase, partial [Pseudomonadota bacterium]|nr:adenosylcobinamide-GDP ribazoletransferase [Pseudomonadota bacterium]
AGVALAGFDGFIAIVVAALLFAWLRQVIVRRLGGTTGDTAGALLEISEVTLLISVALFS